MLIFTEYHTLYCKADETTSCLGNTASNENDEECPAKCFRKLRSCEEEGELLRNAVPMSTRYKNKGAVNIFEVLIQARTNHRAVLEETSLSVSLDNVEDLGVDSWDEMTPVSLDVWLGKFVQEVANKKSERYPGRTLYQVVGGLKRDLESQNLNDVNIF